MDRQSRTLDVVRKLNLYQKSEIELHALLKKVCEYFDYIKNQKIDSSDQRFLLYLSCKVGVPHYYDLLLKKFNTDLYHKIDDESIGLDTISSLLYESSLYTDENSKLHQYQKDILDLFETTKQNRYFLSASTSFGKTHLVYEIIKKITYKNIVLIFPSISLLTENLARIKERKIQFRTNYAIHTLSDIKEIELKKNNIFIFTPERFLSFLDKSYKISIDFIFVDEIYKIDNGYIIDNEVQENERDVAYRMSLFYGLERYKEADIFLAGPYIEIFNPLDPNYNPSFDLFLQAFGITKLLRNEYEIVKVSKNNIEGLNEKIVIDDIEFNLKGKNTKKAKIQELLNKVLSKKENAIIYCSKLDDVERVAKDFNNQHLKTNDYQSFLTHLKTNFDSKWIVIQALEKGIGIHHGMVPKYIQKEIIDLFNRETSIVNILVSTTTITEGVNTTAKNMIVYRSAKGTKNLLPFDAKNIAGRAGRFMEHYTGRVITLDKRFINVVKEIGQQITHKNYDINAPKKEIDDDITPPEYLDDRSKRRLQEIEQLRKARDIPEHILKQFKVISKGDKIKVYDQIKLLSTTSHNDIKNLISCLNYCSQMSLKKEGFQVILNIIISIVENEKLKYLIETKSKKNPSYSILFYSLNNYLLSGFNGIYKYNLENETKLATENAEEKNKEIDEKAKERLVNTAMRKTSRLIYNIFKYQLVKYLGVFNLMYKFYISQHEKLEFEEVSGIDILLTKLEYNAFSDKAKIASDYGVPQNIVNFYDAKTEDEAIKIKNNLDPYEKIIFEKISTLID